MRFCTFEYFNTSKASQQTNILKHFRPAYLPRVNEAMVEDTPSNFKESGCVARYSFNQTRCIQCETNHALRQSDQITSLMTRGDQAFSSLSLGLHQSQDDDDDVPTPNRGKKVLIFSDGRQRAARLAKTVQDFANNDELRLSVIHLIESKWYNALARKHKLFSLADLYPLYVIHITAAMQDPFEETANYFNPKAMFANNREGIMSRHLAGLAEIKFTENFSIPGPHGIHETFVHEFIDDLEDIEGDHLDAITMAELFVSPVNRTGLMEGTMDQVRKALDKSTGFALLKHIRNKVLIRRILDESVSEFSKRRFGCLLLLLKEAIGTVGSEADALTALRDVSIDADQLKQKMDAAGCGIPQMECDKIAERWSLLNQSGNINDEELMSLFDISEKKINERRSSMQALRVRSLQVMAWWFKQFTPLQPYDKRVQKAALIIREEHNSLPEYASLCLGLQSIECMIYSATDADSTNRLSKFKAHVISNITKYMKGGTNVPTFFFTQLIDFISSRDFSLEDLGIGTIKLIDKKYNRAISNKQEDDDLPEELSDEQTKALRVLYEASARFPIMSTGNYKLNLTGKDSSRGIKDAAEVMYNIHAAKAHPREYKLKKHPDKWGATSSQLTSYFAQVLKVKTSPSFQPVKDLFSNYNQLDSENPFLRSNAEGRYFARAEHLQLVNKSNQTEGVLMCVRCGGTLMHALEVFTKTCAKCGANGDDLIRPYDPQEPLIRLRVEEPWREPARAALNSDVEKMAITLVRAEEHTAQINDPTSQDEMYSHAERFEMLFQDIPLVVPDDDTEFTAAESPVDILSCTTTMEVGIDIGSLTAVALRTVPRERANYQQRVGRAGRGRAEVCVALSWYDNKPYAQHFFSNPSDIIDHPENSPVIYLDNEVIVQRHIWAAILQRFFKRLRFDEEDLMFYGMDANQQKAGLMDSMGTKDDFLEGDFTSDQLYTLKGLKAWMAEVDADETQNNDGEDMRTQNWTTTRDELATLLPEDLHAKVWLPTERRFADTPVEVIDEWMNVLINRFDELNIGFQGGEEE